MRTLRRGFVNLPITVHFPLDEKRSAASFDSKRFEVLEMSHDFIFGIELLRALFKSDRMLAYAGPHALITDAPDVSDQVSVLLSACSLQTAALSYAVGDGELDGDGMIPLISVATPVHSE
jgi:hypothetical protein